MSMDIRKIEIIFIIPENASDEQDCSEYMCQAYEICKQNAFDVRWIKEENYESIETHKTSILVFQSFEGKCFDSVKSSKAIRIVGPWCLLTCIVEGHSVPNLPWPIFNVAMLNCVVACSNLGKNLKQELKYKVQCMGGQYTDALLVSNTHLVTNSVKSAKYVKAADAKVKVMLPSWIEEVWTASQKGNVHANDKEFNKHTCLPFHNLQICSTGFTDIKKRKELEQLVTENGATYSGQFCVGTTDVLICNTTSSEKYKVARKNDHIQCVTFEWIVDSIKNGYALPETSYFVRKGTSTPTKDGEALNPNFSMISAISSTSMLTSNKYILEETVNATILPTENITRKRKSSDAELNEIIDRIDIKTVKQAGTFLDGCGIYLVGFTPGQREKLYKVLNFSGATRYEDVSERITHVIVGDSSCHEYKLLISKSLQSPLVNINWLIDSVKNKLPVSEENYIIDLSSPKSTGSPLSKKSLQLLRVDSSEAEVPVKYFEDNCFEADAEPDLIQQYLKEKFNSQEDTLVQLLKNNKETIDNNLPTTETANAYEETNTCSVAIGETEQNLIFEGLKFLILSFDESETNELKESIESYGGETVPESHEGVLDYIVLPVFETEQHAYNTKAEVVTDYWITECVRENELRQVLYYHKPYTIEKTNILGRCVITISSYSQCERAFLINLIQHLGAISQEQLARTRKFDNLATTHLLSCEASGKKYAAAIKWKIPVVNKDWLLECARTGSFVSEKIYVIKDDTGRASTSTTIGKHVNITSTVLEQGKTSAETSGSIKSNNSSDTPVKRMEIAKKSKLFGESGKKSSCQEVTGFNETLINQVPAQCNTFGSTINTKAKTPTTKIITDIKAANVNSPVNPVNKIMQEVRMWHGVGTTPVTPKLKGDLDDISTPDTPYGAFIRPDPSPHLRKVMLKWINDAPDHRPKRDSTPLSELKRQLWNKIYQSNEVQDENRTPPQNNETSYEENENCMNFEENENVVANNLQQLQEMLTASGGNRKNMKKRVSTVPVEASTSAFKDSQPCTVGWDYMDCNKPEQADDAEDTRKQNIVFMISGVDFNEKENMIRELQNLGAVVSDSGNYDSNCTHLISAKIGRNEKVMSAMAGGKWILHTSYVDESVAAGELLDEEEFEYGNPRAKILLEKNSEAKAEIMHWWRKEISRRGYGAFHDMRAIVVATKRDSLIRIIEAGGGMVIDASPPFEESVFATHCILDVKTIPDLSAYIPLAKQGIYCVHIMYINNFLHRTVKDIRDCILPYFSQYYKQE